MKEIKKRMTAVLLAVLSLLSVLAVPALAVNDTNSSSGVTYTISFNAAGGTGAPPPQTKQHGVDMIIPNQIPSREGYEFYGWATGEHPNFAMYQPGSVYRLNRSEILYAVWVIP